MNQQEIFQNMTKGEWKELNGFISDSDDNLICQFFDRFEDDMELALFNRPAIISAVNNTYGKGINPESVENLYKLLEKELEKYGPDTDGRYVIEEALTAAKL
jgi:hypothetical protein